MDGLTSGVEKSRTWGAVSHAQNRRGRDYCPGDALASIHTGQWGGPS